MVRNRRKGWVERRSAARNRFQAIMENRGRFDRGSTCAVAAKAPQGAWKTSSSAPGRPLPCSEASAE
jgi:hypothetical protein